MEIPIQPSVKSMVVHQELVDMAVDMVIHMVDGKSSHSNSLLQILIIILINLSRNNEIALFLMKIIHASISNMVDSLITIRSLPREKHTRTWTNKICFFFYIKKKRNWIDFVEWMKDTLDFPGRMFLLIVWCNWYLQSIEFSIHFLVRITRLNPIVWSISVPDSSECVFHWTRIECTIHRVWLNNKDCE